MRYIKDVLNILNFILRQSSCKENANWWCKWLAGIPRRTNVLVQSVRYPTSRFIFEFLYLLEFESKSLLSCRWSDFYLWILWRSTIPRQDGCQSAAKKKEQENEKKLRWMMTKEQVKRKKMEETTRVSTRVDQYFCTYDSAEVADRGLAAPAFSRPTFKSIFPMAVFKMAAACS